MNTNPKTFEEAVDGYLENLRKVLLERQYQHGATSINDMGIAGLYWMCRQKLARVKAKINFVDEKIIDGRDMSDDALDLGGYGCIIWLWIKGWWGLPLEDDIWRDDEQTREHVYRTEFNGDTPISIIETPSATK